MAEKNDATQEAILFPELKGEQGWVSIGRDIHVYRDDDMWRVLHGSAVLYEGTTDDVMLIKTCMSQLSLQKLASEEDIGAAFGYCRGTVQRAKVTFLKEGAEGFVPKKRGPKGPRVEPGVERKIVRLAREGKNKSQVVRTVGIPWTTVSRTFKRNGLGEESVQEELPFEETDDVAGEKETADERETAEESPGPEAEAEADSDMGSDRTETAEVHPSEETVAVDDEDVPEERSLPQPCIEVEAGEPAPARDWERVLARFRKLGKPEVDPEFASGAGVPAAGVLLAIALVGTDGCLEVLRNVYGVLKEGFYGLRSVALSLLLSAWLGIQTIDDHQHGTPHLWGRVLGLDRVPEAKTLRRKLREIAPRKLALTFMSKMAEHRIQSRKDTLAVLYADGHVREYHGKRRVSKRYVSRAGVAKPAVEDYWLHDEMFAPLLKVTAGPSRSFVNTLPEIIADVRQYLEDDRWLTLVFDRAGWSPEMFIELMGQNVYCVTYRKNRKRTYPRDEFDLEITAPDRAGRPLQTHKVRDRYAYISGYSLRTVTVLGENGHQTEIISTDQKSETAVIVSQIFSRWGQENFFKYEGAHRSLNRLHSHSFEPVPEAVEVPNPAHKELDKEVKRAEKQLATVEAEWHKSGEKESGSAQLKWWRGRVANLTARRRATPERIRVGDLPEDQRPEQPCDEVKYFMDVLDMSATHIERRLLGMLSKHYTSTYRDGRQLLRQIFNDVGDLAVEGNVVTVTLNALASPHQTRALAGLCEEVNALNPSFPETNVRLRFRAHEHP
jgi:hypothetical protein